MYGTVHCTAINGTLVNNNNVDVYSETNEPVWRGVLYATCLLVFAVVQGCIKFLSLPKTNSFFWESGTGSLAAGGTDAETLSPIGVQSRRKSSEYQ